MRILGVRMPIPYNLNPLAISSIESVSEYLSETAGSVDVILKSGKYIVTVVGGGGAGGENAAATGGAGGTAKAVTAQFTLMRTTKVTAVVGAGGLRKPNGGNGGYNGQTGARGYQGANGGGGAGGGGGGFPTYLYIEPQKLTLYNWVNTDSISLYTLTPTPTKNDTVYTSDDNINAVISTDWQCTDETAGALNANFIRKSDNYQSAFGSNKQPYFLTGSICIYSNGGGGGGGGAHSSTGGGRYSSGGGGGGGGGRYRLNPATMEIESINGQPGAGGGAGWGGAAGNAGLPGDSTNFPSVHSGSGGWSSGAGGSNAVGGGASGGGGGGGSGNHSSAYAGGGGGGAGGDDDAGGGTGSRGNGTSYPGTNHHTTATPSVNWKGETSTFGQGGNNQQDGYNGWIYIRKLITAPAIDNGLVTDADITVEDNGFVTDTTIDVINNGSL